MRAHRSRSRTIVLLLAFVGWLPAALLSAQVASGQSGRMERFVAARSWGFQLQNLDVDRLRRAPHDVLVIDYSKDGSREQAFTPDELAQLRRKPDGSPRLVLSYLSIGEAETYRYYWKWTWGGSWLGNLIGSFLAPGWLGRENRDWSGNHAVRFWDEAWQQIFLGDRGYLDQILDAGFDGVYLDKVDASVERIARGRSSAKDDMRAFVIRIAECARGRSPGFLIVPQNGEELLDDPSYVAVISGIGKEDLLYGETGEQAPNPADDIARSVQMLSPLLRAGKPVLAVEYLDDAGKIAAARSTLEALGYVPLFADRDLGRLRGGDLPETRQGPGQRSRRKLEPL